MRKRMNEILRIAGSHHKGLTPHSSRGGGAIAALRRGVSQDDIKRRWKRHLQMQRNGLTTVLGRLQSSPLDSFNTAYRPVKLHYDTMESESGPMCTICGSPGAQIHYRAMACGSCKVFFVRTLRREVPFMCDNDGKCVVTK
ncbi:zinc finger, C4 type, partial [Teladorsagia circumcincta]